MLFAPQVHATDPIRFFVPKSGLSVPLETELHSLVESFNQLHSTHPIQIERRGQRFSTIEALVAAKISDRLPDLALIEPSQSLALRKANIPLTSIKSRFLKSLRRELVHDNNQIPFLRSIPVLVINQEILFRQYLDPSPELKSFQSLQNFIQKTNSPTGLIFPFHDSDGLWILETLLATPFWTRVAGGVQANRSSEASLKDLARFSHFPSHLERAIQDFSTGRTPFLVLSLDHLHLLSRKVKFRWSFQQLPSKQPSLQSGSDLVVIRSSEGVQKFLEFLYHPRNLPRWTTLAGFIPLQKKWKSEPRLSGIHPQYERMLRAITQNIPPRFRPSDAEIVPLRARWQQAFAKLFQKSPFPKDLTPFYQRLDTIPQ